MQYLGSNVIPAFLAGLAVPVFLWVCSIVLGLPFVYRRRRDLFQFFGLTKGKPKLTVFFPRFSFGLAVQWISAGIVGRFGARRFRQQSLLSSNQCHSFSFRHCSGVSLPQYESGWEIRSIGPTAKSTRCSHQAPARGARLSPGTC